jgi:glycosyltransferase involved in cell wall biosynthesis
LKIVFATDGIYPFVLGGMQKHAAYIIRNLAGTEHKLDVIIPDNGVKDAEEASARFWGNERPDNIRFHVIPYPKLPRFPGHYVIASYLYSRRITNYFSHKISTADILFGKGYTMWHWLARQRRPQIPVIVQLHGLEMFQPAFAFREMLDKMLMRIPAVPIIRLTDYIFSYGGGVREILLKQGRSEETIFEQYGAVDDFWLYPEPTKKDNGLIRKFLFVARNEYRKGYHLLYETLQELVTDNETFEIDIVGELSDNLKIEDFRIRYHGNLSAESLKELKEKCEVLLLPSLSEGFPTIIIESMARGLCVAATGVGAVPKVIDEHTGWLLKTGDSQSLKDRMKAIIRTNSGVLRQKQMAAYEKVLDDFQWESTVNQLVSHLETAAHDYRERIARQQPQKN